VDVRIRPFVAPIMQSSLVTQSIERGLLASHFTAVQVVPLSAVAQIPVVEMATQCDGEAQDGVAGAKLVPTELTGDLMLAPDHSSGPDELHVAGVVGKFPLRP
jgi:hypothetical protein